MCFIWIWEQTAIISLYSINWLVCITETECVYCAVRTGYLNVIWVIWFIWIWEQTAIISVYSFNWLVCITDMKSVYNAVRTGYLKIMYIWVFRWLLKSAVTIMRTAALHVSNYAENSMPAAVFLYPHRNTRNLFPCPVAHALQWQDTHTQTLAWMKAPYVNNCCMPCHFTGVSRDVTVRTIRLFCSRGIFRVFLSRP